MRISIGCDHRGLALKEQLLPLLKSLGHEVTDEGTNLYAQSTNSGDARLGEGELQNAGSIVSGALENSNVDIAEELTNMIESQRSYTANSKVFQTGADLMDILVNLKR